LFATFIAFLKQQEAQDNERSSVDHGAVFRVTLEHALKATEAAFLEMADRYLVFSPDESFLLCQKFRAFSAY
jgi:hypothetical protein